jgi:UDP-N-acetylmuramoyl-L-alanyl-D-glutamate--2,6-diaminopimelate ligase
MSPDRWLPVEDRSPPRLAGSRSLGALVERLRSEGRLLTLRRGAHRPDPAPGLEGIEISGIADDSRSVQPGNVFAAVRGLRVDGHAYLAEAIANGATAVLVERPSEHAVAAAAIELVVDRADTALASAAAWWFADPSRELDVVGVTGTNGKTTTTFLAAAALEAVDRPTGLIGTIGIRIAGELRRNDVPTTTPGAIELQGLLRAMVLADREAVVIETSSHGLAAERVGSVAYDAAIFTNLSHEHLDFHGTFEAYRAAKLSLFERLPRAGRGGRPGIGIVNIDDAAGRLFQAATVRAGARSITYGLDPDADVRLIGLEADASSSRFEVDAGGTRLEVALRIGGRFNARNALAVIGLGLGWDLDLSRVVEGLGALSGVPGRLESVRRGQPFHVVIDYAHTPGSLDAVVRELSELAAPQDGQVISVFGASGERDVGKRALMGRAAGALSRIVIVTEDDSRNEDPGSIYEAIAAGATAAGLHRDEDLFVIPDRRAAIAEAFSRARPADVVLLAGKGHETWNVGPAGPEPWSERDAAEAALADLGYRGDA